MKYRMYIRETNFGIAEVEADSPEEAEKLSEHYYFNGKVQWESTRLRQPSGVVCLLCIMVCRSMRIYRDWRLPEVRRMRQWRSVVQRS